MTLKKNWMIGLIWAFMCLCLCSCIDDEGDDIKCVPTIPAEVDLIDSWKVEWRKVIEQTDEQMTSQQDFTKDEGKSIEIKEDHTWSYNADNDSKPLFLSGTWKYQDGILYLNTTDTTGKETSHEIQVFRLCSLRLRAEYKYQIESNGIVKSYISTGILLRDK